MSFDFAKGYKSLLGILGLVAVGIVRQYELLPEDALQTLQTLFQGLLGYGLVLKAQRLLYWTSKKK